MSQPFLTVIATEAAEKTTLRITGTIQDHTGAALPSASLTTLKLWLYNKRTGVVLNNRMAVNVLNANGGTVTSGGLLTMVLDPADNALESQSLAAETHVAEFEWTYNAGAATGRALVEFNVRNFTKVS